VQTQAGKDSPVAYSSAHVDYVEFYSCQQKPATIDEVRANPAKAFDGS